MSFFILYKYKFEIYDLYLLIIINMSTETRYCMVAGCLNPHTHTTPGHKCSLCGDYGHGELECNNSEAKKILPKRSHGSWKFDIHAGVRMPYNKQCTIPGCQYKWSHSACYHHCKKCGGHHHSSSCLITDELEWKTATTTEYEMIKDDLVDHNNVYVIFCDYTGVLRVVRKKNNELNLLSMTTSSWINTEHTALYSRFVEDLYMLEPTFLNSIIHDIIALEFIYQSEDDEEDEEEEILEENEVKCPVCRTINLRDEIKVIKGSGDKCSICYENPVELYFSQCEHACICSECYDRL